MIPLCETTRTPAPFSVAPALEAAGGPEERFALYRKLWDQAGRYEILTDFPLHLDIELSGLCNLSCEFCFQNHITTKRGLMSFSLYTRIIDEGAAKGLCAIKLQVRGESLLHPGVLDCVRYAKDQGILDVQLTTNATLLDRGKAIGLMEAGLDALIVSVDHHHAASSQSKDRPAYSIVEANIRDFLRWRGESGRTKPWVRIASSLPELGEDRARETRQALAEKFPGAEVIALNRMHDFRPDRDSYPDLQTRYTMLPCSHLTQRLAIFWDGAVTTCCMDYNNSFALGDANGECLQNIWHSPGMARLRRAHASGHRKTIPICSHCHASTVGGHRDLQPVMHALHVA